MRSRGPEVSVRMGDDAGDSGDAKSQRYVIHELLGRGYGLLIIAAPFKGSKY